MTSGPVATESDRVIIVVPSPTDDGSIDGTAFFRCMSTGRLRALILAVVLGGLGVTHAVLAEKKFRAEALVMASTPTGESASSMFSGSLGTLASLAGLSGGELDARRTEYLALLKSNTLLESFIKQRNLMPVLFASRWDATSKTWRKGWLGGDDPRIGDAVDMFQEHLLKVDAGKEGLIRVQLEWKDPMVAAEWTNALIRAVNEHVRSRTISDARKGIEFLDRELKSSDTLDLRSGIYRLHETNLNKIMLANVQEDYALRIVDAAVTPLKPVWPRKLFDVAAGIMLGLLAGFGSTLWRTRKEWWQPTASRLTKQ